MIKFKKLLSSVAVAAAFGVSGFAQAGVGYLDGILLTDDGTQGNPYEIGVLTTSWTTLAVTVTGAPSSSFEEFANFTAASTPGATSAAFTLNLVGGGTWIDNLFIEVWDNTHPGGFNLITTFSGNNTLNTFVLNPGGQYHFDISGDLGPLASQGQYSIQIAAIPEPETYAMLLAGLGLMGFVARRRKLKLATA